MIVKSKEKKPHTINAWLLCICRTCSMFLEKKRIQYGMPPIFLVLLRRCATSFLVLLRFIIHSGFLVSILSMQYFIRSSEFSITLSFGINAPSVSIKRITSIEFSVNIFIYNLT